MKKAVLYRVAGYLLSSEIDGTTREMSHWHIDDIDKTLQDQKNVWYQKSVEYFVASYLVGRQVHAPWDIKLGIHLKDGKKTLGQNINSINTLCKDFSDIPPEILAYMKSVPTPGWLDMSFPFIAPYTECVLYETYDARDRAHYRTLIFAIRKSFRFRLMTASLFRRFSFDSMNLSHVRAVDQRRIDAVKKMLKIEPNNCVYLVELGALFLLVHDNIDEATSIFEKVLNIDSHNIDARFWLATVCYYCLEDAEQAKNYISEALQRAPDDARCLSFMHLISWHMTKSQGEAIDCLKAAIKAEPHWILPRIQLIIFLLYNQQPLQARDVLFGFKKVSMSKSTGIIDRYYATYVIGNIPSNACVIEWFMIASRAVKRTITSEEAEFLTKIGFTLPQ